jgi:hypothetical protein
MVEKQKDLIGVMHKGVCEGHHDYKMGLSGQLILCEHCGRIKAVKEGEGWKMMY